MAGEAAALLMGRPRRSTLPAMSALAALAAVAIIASVALISSSKTVELAQKHAMSTSKADNDLRAYFSEQAEAAASAWKPSKDKQLQMKKEKHLLAPAKAPRFSAKAADASLNAYFDTQAAIAQKPRKAITPHTQGPAKKVKEAAPKHGMSTADALGDLDAYFKAARPTKAQAKAKESMKGVTQKLFLPFYEVASTGDGLGPEEVSIWSVPPGSSGAGVGGSAAAKAEGIASGGTSALAGYPLPPNTYQDATKWNADSALNGGNKEWAEEDAALHAYNMQRWRNKILDEQVRRQRTQWDLMNAHDDCDYQCDGGRCWCAHYNADYRSTKSAGVPTLKGVSKSATLTDDHVWEDDRKKEDLEGDLKLLEKDAAKALAALEVHGEDKAEEEDEVEAKQMAAIIKAIEREANHPGEAKEREEARKSHKAARKGAKAQMQH